MATGTQEDLLRRIRVLEQKLFGTTTPPSVPIVFPGTAADANILQYVGTTALGQTVNGWVANPMSGNATIDDAGVVTITLATSGGDIAGSLPGPLTVEEAVATNSTATGSVAVDFSAARVHKLTMTGTVSSLTVNNAVNGRACGITLYMIQDGTGSRTVTTWTNFKWPGGTTPTLSTAASAIDIIVAESTDGGTTWYANLAGKGYA